jgi:hypothetical protein
MYTSRDGGRNSVNFGRVDYGPADTPLLLNPRLSMGEWIGLPKSSTEEARRVLDSVRPSGTPSKPIIKRAIDTEQGASQLSLRDSALDMDMYTKIANREEVRN